MKRFGFNFNNGRVDLSLHPFCGGYKDDIRITTKFNKFDFFSSFESFDHETGTLFMNSDCQKNGSTNSLENPQGWQCV